MPKLVEDATAVTKFIEEKQKNEVDLSDALIKAFGSPPLIDALRKTAATGLAEMVNLLESTRDQTTVINKAMVDAMKAEVKANMQILKNMGNPKGVKNAAPIELPAALPGVLKNAHTFGPAECSDIIRLYGTMVEELGKRTDDKGVYKAFMNDKAQKESDIAKFGKSNPVAYKELQAIIEKSWNAPDGAAMVAEEMKKMKTLEEMKKVFRFDVAGDKSVWNTGQIAGYGRHREMLGKMKVDEKEFAKLNMPAVQKWLADTRGGGASLFNLKDTSTVGRIDRTFGLVPAADISGTTADTIFFFDKMFTKNVALSLDPIFYMLPTATIVAGNHHSMVEVALPLTHNDRIHYVIGFYSTLLPPGSTLGAAGVKAALDKAEKDPRNRHMLCFYSAKAKVAGCYQFEEKELAAFKKFADGATVMQTFITKLKEATVGWPSKAEVQKIIKDEMKLTV